MTRASYNNQARIHNGYHYPRSVLTALRSRISFPKFCMDFSNCVVNDFDKYYMVGRHLSKVTSHQFEKFCSRIGASLEPAPSNIVKLTNKNFIDSVYTAKEFTFDSIELKKIILERIDSNYVNIHLNSSVDKIEKTADGLVVSVTLNDSIELFSASHVFNCAYSNLNNVISKSNLEIIPLKHEMTEMALVDVPDSLRSVGITVMCGPFFSVMPFPSVRKNDHYLHSFSHVRYTPHYEWLDSKDGYVNAYERFTSDQKNTAWDYMVKDASRYIPCLSECRYERSLWEVKTVLPRSENDDSRPILCKFNYGIQGFHCVMGGKIDNAYDAVEAIQRELGI